MCGILGTFTVNPPPDLQARLQAGLKLLQHRGPDDQGLDVESVAGGTLAMGHTRLSIIDLSPGGHQPMHSPDGHYTIVFNGEIYNYRELGQELRTLGHAFQTESDTEVLLAAWAQWGTESLCKLIGMFAFAVFDRQAQVLTLARDAFGIKPLFFAATAESLLFASEMGALLALRDTAPQLHAQRAYDYLIHGVQDSGFDTFVRGVQHVPPAYWVRFDLRAAPLSSVSERWWNPSIAETSTLSFNQAAEALRALFLDSVRLHLRSDVPLGVALSGGIDSSAIAGAMRHLEPQMDIHTFSYIGEGDAVSEEPWIDQVNTHIHAVPHKVRVAPNDLAADVGELIRVQGEPFCTTSMYAQYRVFRAAREAGITVVLEGQGGDELLAGYQGYQGQRMRSLLERGQWAEMWRFSRRWKQWPGRSGRSAWRGLAGQLLPDRLFRLFLPWVGIEPAWLNLEELRRQGGSTRPARLPRVADARGRRVPEVLLRAISEGGLPSLLRYGDRNAMAFSIENRVPFLTLPLAELLLSLPEHYLISPAGETKAVFRAAMRGIVPHTVLDRRDKIGFETPMGRWVEHILEAAIANGSVAAVPVFDAPRLEQRLQACLGSDARFGSQDWRIANLLLWGQQKHIAHA